MDADWSQIRAEFPSLRNWTFLDTATFGQLPERTAHAVERYYARRYETAAMDFLSWFDDADRLRASLARLIRCQSADIAFIPTASQALSLLISNLEWRPGDRIVTLEHEFPNNIYHPALLSATGVELVKTDWPGFFDAITGRTRLVTLSTVNYSTGFRPPLEKIIPFLRARGVLLFLDGTQSVGALEFDAAALEPDMLAVHGYKWLLAPPGVGFLYVRPELRARIRPVVVGWRSHKGWREVDNLHHGAPSFVETAEKYEGGMLPFAQLYGMQASVDLLLEIGPRRIERRVLELAERAREVLRQAGAELPEGHFHSPVIAARFEGVDASGLAKELRARRLAVSARSGALRVSTHFYNNEADLDCLARELRALL